MGAIFAALARPLLEAVLSAFGNFIIEMVNSWRLQQEAEAKGRAEAVAEAALEATRVGQEMTDVPLPSDDDVLKRLGDGTA